jgi:hypothetical protein
VYVRSDPPGLSTADLAGEQPPFIAITNAFVRNRNDNVGPKALHRRPKKRCSRSPSGIRPRRHTRQRAIQCRRVAFCLVIQRLRKSFYGCARGKPFDWSFDTGMSGANRRGRFLFRANRLRLTESDSANRRGVTELARVSAGHFISRARRESGVRRESRAFRTTATFLHSFLGFNPTFRGNVFVLGDPTIGCSERHRPQMPSAFGRSSQGTTKRTYSAWAACNLLRATSLSRNRDPKGVKWICVAEGIQVSVSWFER